MIRYKLSTSHRQLGIVASFWLCLAAITALFLNHRQMFISQDTSHGPYGQYLLSHAISPHDPNEVLVGTSNGLFLSDDAGKTFREVALPIKASQVVGVAFHPTDGKRLYAALRLNGLYSSRDGGKFWEGVSIPGNVTIQSLAVGFDATLSVLTPSGIYTRTDETWRLAPAVVDPKNQEAQGRGLASVMYSLHDGQFYGKAAVFVTDCVSLSLLWLCFSGLWLSWHHRGRKSADGPL